MKKLSDRINLLLKLGVYKQKEIAKAGQISESAISKMKKGVSGLDPETARNIEAALGISAAWLLTGEGDVRVDGLPLGSKKTRSIQILGYIPAGFPGVEVSESNVIGTTSDDEAPEGTYGLLIKGDCMAPGIREGDLALFTPGNGARPGDLVITLDENGFSQLKRYGERDGRGILVCDNPAFPAIESGPETRIVGIVWKVNRAVYKRVGKA